VGETTNINDTLRQRAVDFFVNETVGNLLRDPLSDLPPSSIDQAGIFVRTEEMLRAAGYRGTSVAVEMNRIMNEQGLNQLATERGVALASVFSDTNVEDQFLRLKGTNDGTQIVWDRAGALTVQGLKVENYIAEQAEQEQSLWNRLRGGGSSTPTYNAPDRRTVEDAVRSRLKLTVGTANESRVDWLTDMYLRDHRKDFDSRIAGTGQIDPSQTVKEEIRKLPDYMEIHEHRPEDVDEESWLPKFIADQREQGVQFDAARERGVKLATVGATDASAQEFQTQRLGGGNFLQNAAMVGSIVGKVMR
jgi:hypothetical protein